MADFTVALKFFVNAMCCIIVMYYMYKVLADYFDYNVQSSTFVHMTDSQPAIVSFCSINDMIDRRVFDSLVGKGGSQLLKKRFVKESKFVDGTTSVVQCMAVTEKSHSTSIGMEFAILQHLNIYLSERVPSGNSAPFARIQPKFEYTLKYNRYTVDRLPFPFATNCKNYRTDQFGCVDECDDELVACVNACSRLACHQSLFLNDQVAELPSSRNRTLVVVVSSETMSTKFLPSLTLDKLLIYLAGVICTFFGCSFWNAHSVIYRIAYAIYGAIAVKRWRERTRKSIRLSLKLLLKTTAIAGYMFQTVPLTHDYFTYAMQSQFYKGKMYAAIAVIPDVSICVKDNGHLSNSNTSVLRSVTVQTSDGHRTFTSEHIAANGWLSRYTENPTADISCFMFHLSKTGATHTITHLADQMAKLDVTSDHGIELFPKWFSLHQPKKQSALSKMRQFTEGTYHALAKVLFTFFHYRLLPAPFATRCQHYDHLSREAVLVRCYRKLYNISENEVLAQLKRCNAIAPECDQVNVQWRNLINPFRNTTLLVDFMSDCMRYEVIPKLSFSTYLIYCGMIAGFWLSVSILPVSNYVANMISNKVAVCTKVLRNYSCSKVMIVLICSAMSCTVYDETKTYLEYKVITNTELGYPRRLQLPAMSVGFLKHHSERNFSRVASLTSNYTNISIDQYFDLIVVIHRIQVNDLVDTSVAKFTRKGALLTVRCTELSVDDTAYLMVHEPNSYSRTILFRSRTQCSQSTQIKLNTFKSKLLPPPYATGCRCYLDSQQACFEECIQRSTFEKFEQYSIVFPRSLNQTPAGVVIDQDAFHECQRNCSQPDCESTKYIFSTTSVDEPNVLFAVGPHMLMVESEYVAQYTLGQFILNVCGLVALWCGLAVCDVYHVIKKVADVLHKICFKTAQRTVSTDETIVVTIRVHRTQ